MTGTLAPAVSVTAQRCAQVLTEIERVIVGKRTAVAQVLLGILASGHILIEDLPGLGKTLLARSFATALGLEFTRVQFTPDMLPSDLSWAPVSQWHYDHGIRPLLTRLAASALAEHHRVDLVATPARARSLVGEEIWPHVDPSRAASQDSKTPGADLGTLTRIVDQLEQL